MTISIRAATGAALAGLALMPALAKAQTSQEQAQQAPQQAPQQMPGVTVVAPAEGPVAPVSPVIERYAVPNTVQSTDTKKIENTVNIIDVEDAVKYMPSLLVRKRNYGDTQPTLATRMWGINSSARNLVYVDDMLISALIANNNTNGAPRWGLVSPEEIKGIDMLYGPYSAAYPGNSMGGVMLITTRMPEKFEATLKQTEAFQNFGIYGTFDTYVTSNTAGTLGGKVGNFSYFLAANREESFSQPLTFVTNGGAYPAGTQGTYQAVNKSGVQTNVVGAGGLLHTIMTNYKLKWAVEVNDWLTFSHTIGYWANDAHANVQTYLTNNSGPTFGGVSGFGSNTYNLTEQHLANAISLKSDTKGTWDFDIAAMYYYYLNSMQRGPTGVGTGLQFTTAGTSARLDGTNWWTFDAKAIYRPEGISGAHEVSFGVHGDQYTLNNPTYALDNWLSSPDSGSNRLTTFGAGKTQTWGLWAQERWKFAPGWTATVGGRLDMWRAFDGFNIAGAVATAQPPVQAGNFQPKASLEWQFAPEWTTRASFGQAVRYPTVSELYQIVSVGATNVVPNPNLMPESALDFEWVLERKDKYSTMRLTLFEEDTSNALISQTSTINNIPTTNFQNVGLIRNRGFEVAAEATDVYFKGVDLSGSVTYVDSKILSNPSFSSTYGSYSVGMWAPYGPQWRGTAVATYRPSDKWAFTAAARFQGLMYSTLDNSDYVHNVYGAFDPFAVVDLKARYKFMENAAIEVGVDNVGDYHYFLFHPFPQRTFIASLKATF